MNIPKPHWPLFAAAGLLLIIVAVQLTLSLKKNEGHFVYALDDPYIHMAVARDFARYGVWGVTRYEFSSSTSSLLWTLLLSAFYRFTSSPYIPLILNLASAMLLLGTVQHFVKMDNRPAQLLLLSSLILLLPLPPLIFSGMEHTAHLAVCVLLVYAAASLLSADVLSVRTRRFSILLLLAALAPLIRYESLFLIVPIALLLCIRRRYVPAILVVAVAILPLLIYGLISWRYGSEFLPNPLLLKGTMPRAGLFRFLEQAFLKLLSAPHLLLLLLMAVWTIRANRERGIWDESLVISLIFISATALHLLFAGIGWFYRYEAYLIAIGILIVGQAVSGVLVQRKEARWGSLPVTVTLALALITAAMLTTRANRAFNDTIPAMKNTYDQQYQMARFLKTYYSGEAIAANDIGAINFMADLRCLDLRGLGSAEVTRAKLAGTFNTDKIAELAALHQVRIALLYSVWFQGEESVPSSWIKVGEWTTRECVVCGNPTVSFYASDNNEAERLKKNLQAFSTQLPADVAQAGSYYEPR